jgi:phage terminase large subunit
VPRTVSTGYYAREQFVSLHCRAQRWAISVCHRRAGKTVAHINDLIDASIRCKRPSPRHAYVAPYYSQAKDIAWGYLKRYTQNIPGTKANEGELRVDLPGDRRIRLYGADNYERMRGVYFDGVVGDEYGLWDPRAWSEVIRPALADRQGWAAFAGTPNGINHFADMWRAAQSDPDWFTLRLRASETGLLPKSELDDARKQMSDEQYAAEFECSFEASVVGTVFGRQLDDADREGRICAVPWQPELAVSTWWDLGTSDATAIWFTQDVGREIHVIDYYENAGAGVGIDHYVKHLQTLPYVWGTHNGPHDLEAKSFAAGGRSTRDIARGLGIAFRVVPRIQHKHDSINAARVFLKRCWFDKVKTERGRLALTSYRYAWDEKRKVFSTEPYHDWASNGADALQCLGMGHHNAPPRPPRHDFPRPMRMPSGENTGWLGV